MASTPPAAASHKANTSPTTITLHILCPSVAPHNRITMLNLAPSTTIAQLKDKLAAAIATHPVPSTQRLIYGGKRLEQDDVTLEAVLAPIDGNQYSIHLVLPPGPAAPSTPTTTAFSTSMNHGSSNIPHLRHPQYTDNPIGDGLYGLRGPDPVPMQQTSPYPHREPSSRPVASGREISTELDHENREIIGPMQQNVGNENQRQLVWPGQDNSTSARLPHSEAPFSVEEELSRVRRIRELRVDIEDTERQLAVGSLPPMDRIIQMRNELFQMQDARYRNQFAARDGEVESLIIRICNLYQRVDQLHVVQTRFPSWPLGNPSATSIRRSYLVSSPDGFQGILTPPVTTGTVQVPLFAPHTSTQTGPAPVPGPQEGIVENAVRHAVLDQQRRPNHAERRRGLARHLRRIWLFVRLYFFCYMISDSGSWTRIIFVGCALLFALISDTGIPQQLHGMMVAPIQRHLEGLVHIGESGEQNAQTQAQAGATQPATSNHEQDNNVAGGIQHHIRRAERSFLLFLASLIPGIGERQVEVRNAAEAAQNAQRARQEEEQQREQAAPEADHNENTNANNAQPAQEMAGAGNTV